MAEAEPVQVEQPAPTPQPVQQVIQQPAQPERKWYQLSPEAKRTLWDIKYLIGTLVVLALTQILQPAMAEIMETEWKPIWKTYSSILLPALLTTTIAIVMKLVQGKGEDHLTDGMQYGQIQQMPQQYMQQGYNTGMGYVNQGVQYGQGLLNQGATYGQGLIQQGTNIGTGLINQGIQAIPQVPQVQYVQPAPQPVVVQQPIQPQPVATQPAPTTPTPTTTTQEPTQ